MGLLREYSEYAKSGRDVERQLMSEVMWLARKYLRDAAYGMIEPALRAQPDCFALLKWPTVAAFKAAQRGSKRLGARWCT